jgi:hypothetical protein
VLEAMPKVPNTLLLVYAMNRPIQLQKDGGRKKEKNTHTSQSSDIF